MTGAHHVTHRPAATPTRRVATRRWRSLYCGGRLAVEDKALPRETEGAYLLREAQIPARMPWVLSHQHPEMEEALYVVAGRLAVRVAGEEMTLLPGSFLLIPRGVTHAFANHDLEPATVLTWFSPPPLPRAAGARPESTPTATPPRIQETGIKAVDLLCPLPAGGAATVTGALGTGLVVLVEELAYRLVDAPEPLTLHVPVRRKEVAAWQAAFLKVPWYSGGTAGAVRTRYWSRDVPVPDESRIALSPALAGLRYYPAVDPAASLSPVLNSAVAGAEHVAVAAQARDLLRRYPPETEPDERGEAGRAQRLRAFLTQPFYVATPSTGLAGVAVSLAETLAGCRAILAGECDGLPEAALRWTSTLTEARAQAGRG